MSRPSGNKFADFFPTAPSVLQQRKASKTALQKTRSEAREELSEDAPNEKVSARSSASGEETHVLRQTSQTENTKPECVSVNQDESEHFTGDLLNGVGSASSTSTASSVFSSTNLNSAMALSNGIHLHAMTPLTNADLSPPPKMISPINETDVRIGNATITADSTSAGPAMSPQRTPPAARKAARERGYVVKGSKVVYDPDLDKKVNAKDRKKMKAQFADFGTRAEDEIPPPDPRLAIPNYMRGAAGKQKSKFRPSPYSLRPWPYDAATSIGMAPPTTVVATGFDPMAPVSQISALFSSFGEIAEINNRTDPTTGRFLGICSIRYKDCKSFRGGAPLLAVNAAKRAYTEGKKGQRIGTSAIRIDIDREGAIVKKLIERAIASQRKETAVPESPKPPPTATKTEGPPPTAPKGPSGRPSIRPPPPALIPHHTLYATTPKLERPPKPVVPSLVETTPILPQLKHEPYVFIAHCYVPVLSTTIPHLKKRLKMYDWTDVRCDETGYFITFENSKRGEIEAKRVYDGCHMNALFTYVMNMELQQYGNPNIERSPTPDKTQPRPVPVVVPRVDNKRLKRERDLDLEEEKRQRARDMDPSRAVLQLVIQEVRDKLMEDVRSRIAAPALYEYLDPDKHIEKRRRLGIEDPQGGRRQGVIHTDATPSAGTPDSRAELSMKGRQPLRNKNLNVLSLPRINKNRTGLEQGMSGFRDERRKGPAPRAYIRPLFHQLAQFHDESDSDDEQRTSLTRDTEDLETRPPSRMSMTSVSDDEDELLRKATKKRMHDREDSEMPDSIVKEEPDTATKTSAEDLIIAKLERSIYEMSPSSRKRKRLIKELEARKRQKEDDELFGIGKFEAGREDSVDVKMSEADTPSNLEATPDIESDAPKPVLKKPKPKKKTKKQIAEERAALRQEQMEAEATEIVDEVLEFAEEEEKQAELEERRPVVEWGVSTLEAERTVDDDLKIIPDIDGWQGSLYDDEDIQLLIEVTRGKVPAPVGNLTAWTWMQKELRNIKRYHSSDSVDPETGIEGYYVPNPTGSARTEPIRKILESEKSKYLPHRLKVQRAREQREAEATRDPKAADAAKNLAKASSRGKRVEDRRAVKEIDMQRDLLQSINGDADVLRFNQLKKRKKPVKFARSAIHNWGLYSLERIQASEMIIEYVGEKVRQEIADLREIKYTQSGIGSSYLFRIDEGSVVDATKKGGIARFINHSCMPNCTAKIIRVDGTKRIVIYALRDIEKGKFSRTSFIVGGRRRANIPSQTKS